jgi:hypothetical protein
MALAYSERFSRWITGRPGYGFSSAALSSCVSNHEVSSVYAALSGRLTPCGGIVPERSLRTTFSQTSGFEPTSSRLEVSSVSPAVLSFWLWQVTQYVSRIWRECNAPSCAVAECRTVDVGMSPSETAMTAIRPRTPLLRTKFTAAREAGKKPDLDKSHEKMPSNSFVFAQKWAKRRFLYGGSV